MGLTQLADAADALAAAREYRLPEKGPRKWELYVMCGALAEADHTQLVDGVVKAVEDGETTHFEITPEEIDELEALGWVDLSRAVDAVDVTPRGLYYVGLFRKANPALFPKKRVRRAWARYLRRTFVK